MAGDYAALAAAWNSLGKPAGTQGTDITVGMTQAQKLDAVNSWTVASPLPAILTPNQVWDAFDANEVINASGVPQFTQLQVSFLVAYLSRPSIDVSVGKSSRIIGARILAGKSASISNFNSILSPYDDARTEWWRSNGFEKQIGTADLTLAGLS